VREKLVVRASSRSLAHRQFVKFLAAEKETYAKIAKLRPSRWTIERGVSSRSVSRRRGEIRETACRR